MITNDAKILALNAVISVTMDSVSVISLQNASGEFFRKIPTDTEYITPQKKQFTFWLNEYEGNDEMIIGLSLYGNGATSALGSGTELVKQPVNIAKSNVDSLTIVWNVEVTEC